MKADWLGYILRRNGLLNRLLKERFKGRESEEEDLSNSGRDPGNEKILENERENLHSLENCGRCYE
jgi:hypothetical protein